MSRIYSWHRVDKIPGCVRQSWRRYSKWTKGGSRTMFSSGRLWRSIFSMRQRFRDLFNVRLWEMKNVYFNFVRNRRDLYPKAFAYLTAPTRNHSFMLLVLISCSYKPSCSTCSESESPECNPTARHGDTSLLSLSPDFFCDRMGRRHPIIWNRQYSDSHWHSVHVNK